MAHKFLASCSILAGHFFCCNTRSRRPFLTQQCYACVKSIRSRFFPIRQVVVEEEIKKGEGEGGVAEEAAHSRF